MATVTGKTSFKIDELVNNTVTSGYVDPSGHLILTTFGGSEIDAGKVKTLALDSWPIGSIYSTVEDVDPASILGGGTWIRWGNGQIPVGVDEADPDFDTVEKTGGEKEHTLTTSELPSHTHAIDHDHPSFNTASGGTHGHSIWMNTTAGASNPAAQYGAFTGRALGNTQIDSTTGAHQHAIDVPAYVGDSGSEGSDVAHNNLQPYITCYLWKRTA